LKCLEKNPADRYGSSAALAEDLDRFLRGEGIAARKLTLWDEAARLVRRRQLDVNWGAAATRTLFLAPMPLLVHGAVFVGFRYHPAYPLAALLVTMITVVVHTWYSLDTAPAYAWSSRPSAARSFPQGLAT
jgi:hypothetical protein